MTIHPIARLTPQGRLVLVERVRRLGWAVEDAAQAQGVSRRTAYRWLARFRDEGLAGLRDRSSRPRRSPHRTGAERQVRIERLRRQRLTAAQIAARLDMPRSTVAAVLKRLGLERLSRLEPRQPPVRYEHERAGDLLHLDTKKLGRIQGIGHRIHGDRRRRRRGIGWEIAFVAVDDHSRTGQVEMHPDERGATAAAFLRHVVSEYRRRGIRIRGVLTDNGSCFVSSAFEATCAELGIRHLFTRPYRPCTNGKAERFIQTMLREWAYRRPYRTSNQRTRALPAWLRYYNTERPHSALGHRPPLSRLRSPR